MAAAFHVATTGVPGARPSSCAEASLSSAASGWGAARPTRTRFPTAVTETTLDRQVVLGGAAAARCPPARARSPTGRR